MVVDEILDPWNSRPLDVHRWLEHPEVKVLVDGLLFSTRSDSIMYDLIIKNLCHRDCAEYK